jgi:hypothetical protein
VRIAHNLLRSPSSSEVYIGKIQGSNSSPRDDCTLQSIPSATYIYFVYCYLLTAVKRVQQCKVTTADQHCCRVAIRALAPSVGIISGTVSLYLQVSDQSISRPLRSVCLCSSSTSSRNLGHPYPHHRLTTTSSSSSSSTNTIRSINCTSSSSSSVSYGESR